VISGASGAVASGAVMLVPWLTLPLIKFVIAL
jgi:hypothetical protein